MAPQFKHLRGYKSYFFEAIYCLSLLVCTLNKIGSENLKIASTFYVALGFVNFLHVLLMQCSLNFNILFCLLVQVDNFHNPKLRGQLAEAKLLFPVIVKPQVACGVADAHNMVLSCLVILFSCLGILVSINQKHIAVIVCFNYCYI